MAKNQNKQKTSLYTIIGKIGDFLLWPILIISLASSFFMLSQRKQNKATYVFGYSIVNILSESMLDAGFNKGDMVLTKYIDERDIKLGDIIAFYNSSTPEINIKLITRYKDFSYPINNDSSNITVNTEIDLTTIVKIDTKKNEYLEKAQENKARIFFHQVVGIYVDDTGSLFFKTKGTNNSSPDTTYIRGDLVVGRYVNTPQAIRSVVGFCASTAGMILLVCIPLSLLVLMQSLSLIEQISIIALEKKLMSGQLSYKDEEIVKELPAKEIELYNKVYFYYITPKEEREAVKNFLWGYLENSENLTTKENLELSTVISSTNLLNSSEIAYFNNWIENTKGNDRKHLIQIRDMIFSLDETQDTNYGGATIEEKNKNGKFRNLNEQNNLQNKKVQSKTKEQKHINTVNLVEDLGKKIAPKKTPPKKQ